LKLRWFICVSLTTPLCYCCSILMFIWSSNTRVYSCIFEEQPARTLSTPRWQRQHHLQQPSAYLEQNMGLKFIDIHLWICGQVKLIKIGFSYANRGDFTTSKFKCLPKIILVIFRGLSALYTVAFAVATGLESKDSFIEQMPLFSQVLGAIYFFVSAISTEVSFFRKIRKFSTHRETFFTNNKRKLKRSPTLETISDTEQQTPFASQNDIPEKWIEASCEPIYKETTHADVSKEMNLFWYHKLQWILYDVSVSLNFTFTLTALCFREKILFSDSGNYVLRINTFVITSILLFIDFIINAIPLRIIHFIYPFFLNLIYFVTIVIYTQTVKDTAKIIPALSCTKSECLEQVAIILGIGSFAVHVILCFVKCFLDAVARHQKVKDNIQDSSVSQRPASRKISRASRNSDSTQMTSLDSCKTFAIRSTWYKIVFLQQDFGWLSAFWHRPTNYRFKHC